MKFKEVEPGMVLWYSHYSDKYTQFYLNWANVFFVKRKHPKAHLVWGYFLTIDHNGLPRDESEEEVQAWNDRMVRLIPLPSEKFKVILRGIFGDFE
jgi:hypothetical protein